MSSSRDRRRESASARDEGFTLVEVLIASMVLTIGLIGIAGMLVSTTTAQIAARESARSVRLAQTRMDELLKLPFTSASVAIGGGLDANLANYSETPDDATDVRWQVTAGPNDDLRIVTVRVINRGAQQARRVELASIIRE